MELLQRVDVQKRLMEDLHSRGVPFESKKDKVDYCDRFYKSLGCEYGRNRGRVPIHVSSAVRHFFHNNLQIGDVPKWARDDAVLIRRFIEVLKIYGPDKAKVKARRATLGNEKRIAIIPLNERENFVHLLDGFEVSVEEEESLRRTRKERLQTSPLNEQKAVDNDKTAQLKQIMSLLAGNHANRAISTQLTAIFQNAGLLAQSMNQAARLASTIPVLPSTSALLHTPTPSPPSFSVESPPPTVEDKENIPLSTASTGKLKHSYAMENILDRIKKKRAENDHI